MNSRPPVPQTGALTELRYAPMLETKHFGMALTSTDSELPPVCCARADRGAMGRFMLTTMASVADLEAGLISERTKAALKAAKARGMKLGHHGAEGLAPGFEAEACQRALSLEPVITD